MTQTRPRKISSATDVIIKHGTMGQTVKCQIFWTYCLEYLDQVSEKNWIFKKLIREHEVLAPGFPACQPCHTHYLTLHSVDTSQKFAPRTVNTYIRKNSGREISDGASWWKQHVDSHILSLSDIKVEVVSL